MNPSEEQEFVKELLEMDSRKALTILLLIAYLKDLRQEIKIIERKQEIRKRKIQQLNDLHYVATHCACPTCGALPNKRARLTSGEYKRKGNQPACLRQSKL